MIDNASASHVLKKASRLVLLWSPWWRSPLSKATFLFKDDFPDGIMGLSDYVFVVSKRFLFENSLMEVAIRLEFALQQSSREMDKRGQFVLKKYPHCDTRLIALSQSLEINDDMKRKFSFFDKPTWDYYVRRDIDSRYVSSYGVNTPPSLSVDSWTSEKIGLPPDLRAESYLSMLIKMSEDSEQEWLDQSDNEDTEDTADVPEQDDIEDNASSDDSLEEEQDGESNTSQEPYSDDEKEDNQSHNLPLSGGGTDEETPEDGLLAGDGQGDAPGDEQLDDHNGDTDRGSGGDSFSNSPETGQSENTEGSDTSDSSAEGDIGDASDPGIDSAEGSVTGDTPGDTHGDMDNPAPEDVSGDIDNFSPGDTSGDAFGDTSGDIDNSSPGDTPGDASGIMQGNTPGDSDSELTGNDTGSPQQEHTDGDNLLYEENLSPGADETSSEEHPDDGKVESQSGGTPRQRKSFTPLIDSLFNESQGVGRMEMQLPERPEDDDIIGLNVDEIEELEKEVAEDIAEAKKDFSMPGKSSAVTEHFDKWSKKRLKTPKANWKKIFPRLMQPILSQGKMNGMMDMSYAKQNPNQKHGPGEPILMGWMSYPPNVSVLIDASPSMVSEKDVTMREFVGVMRTLFLKFTQPVTIILADSGIKYVTKSMASYGTILKQASRTYHGSSHSFGDIMENLMKRHVKHKGRVYSKPDILVVFTDCLFHWPFEDKKKLPESYPKIMIVSTKRFEDVERILPPWVKNNKNFVYAGD